MLRRYTCVSIIFWLFGTWSLSAQSIRIVAPYAGVLNSRLSIDSGSQVVKDNDNGFLGGLYFQWINPKSFQVNTFLYGSPEVNYATLLGFHISADAYLLPTSIGKFVLGGGYELIRLDLDTQDGFAPATDFDYKQTIQVPFLRMGFNFIFRSDSGDLSLLPWAGGQIEILDGDVTFVIDPPGPPPPTNIKDAFSSRDVQLIIGLNTKVDINHFIQLHLNGRLAFDDSEVQPSIQGMFNLFFTRSLGFSYRMKYTETSAGTELYNLFGLVYSF